MKPFDAQQFHQPCEMKPWRKYGSIALCCWSLLLVLVGISQLIFGAYFISKLPVFKIGSPVWVGFLNILLGTGLFGLHQKRLELRSLLWRLNDDDQAEQRRAKAATKPPGSSGIPAPEEENPVPGVPWYARMNPLHFSLALCLSIVAINLANVLMCEVGEWHHWILPRERPALSSTLAGQAHRVTAAQMSLAVLFGLTCTALNVWLLHKERLSRHEEAPPVVLESVEPVPAQQPGEPRPRSKASSNGKPTGLGFDNPNWVYGTSESNQAGPLKVGKSPQQQQPEQIPAIAAASSSEKPTECGTIMRYATIRRATITSIHGALLPDRPHIQDPPQRPQRLNKSASFRFESEQLRRGSAIVHRSKTMRETSLTSNTFAQRFQARGSDGPSALSFVHDAISEEPPQSLAEKCSIQQVVEQRAVVPSNVPPPPPRPATRPPPIHSVRSSDRIVLRVESFRGSAAMHQPGRTGGRQPTGRAAGRSNVKRVSSSTQTDLSGLSNSSRHQSQQQRGNNGSKRSSVGSGHSSKYSGPSLVVASDEHSAGSGQPPQLSPVESSSGYSSPRGTTDESKSPTPEPPVSAVASSSSNITVIHIEPPPLYHLHPDMQEERQQEPKRVVEATYAIPRKRSERNNSGTSPITPATPTKATPRLENIRCVSIQKQQQPQSSTNRPATFINRSVSFHQMSQSDRRAVYSQEWLGIQQQHPGSSLEVLTTSQSPQVTIPRPALRMSPSPNLYHQQHPHYMTSPSPTSSTTSSMTGRRSNLNRSTSMYLAMSEIQRKLDILQVLTNSNRPQQHQVVPVHHQQHNRQPDDYYSQHYHTHRPSSKRSHSRQGVPTDWSNDSMDSAKTLAYLAELEQLARHWRTQLLYKVELKSSSSSSGVQQPRSRRTSGGEPTNLSTHDDSFQC